MAGCYQSGHVNYCHIKKHTYILSYRIPYHSIIGSIVQFNRARCMVARTEVSTITRLSDAPHDLHRYKPRPLDIKMGRVSRGISRLTVVNASRLCPRKQRMMAVLLTVAASMFCHQSMIETREWGGA